MNYCVCGRWKRSCTPYCEECATFLVRRNHQHTINVNYKEKVLLKGMLATSMLLNVIMYIVLVMS